jgi:WD40 repeat protein
MYHVADAGYLYRDREGCMKGTRIDVLLQLEHWLKDGQDKRVFWLNGLAGTGKSTIAHTFAEMSFADRELGASFFCSRDFKDRSSLRSIFPTLAFQLAHQYPDFRRELLPVLKSNRNVGRESLTSQLEKLLVGPFRTVQIPTLIIIDALDECRDEEPASALLSVLSRYVDEIPLVKFFITGRPEPRIRSGFRLELLQPHTDVLRLHDVKPDLVNSDIKLFLKAQLTNIAKNRSNCDFSKDWPGPQAIDALCKKAAGFFIYASTVIKFIGSQSHLPNERLDLVISLPQDTSCEGKSGIDLLYTQVLEQAFHEVDQDFFHLKFVVGAVVLILHPLSINALSDLLMNCGTPSRIYNALRPLHSLLLLPNRMDGQVHVFHKSFPDFITNPERCKAKQFFVDPSIYHREILLSCLNVMKGRLKKNICNLDSHAVLSEVEDLFTRWKDHIGDALEYACCFWTKHLLETPSSGSHVDEVRKAIDGFFTTCLPYWIEVLALVGSLGLGVYAINDVEQWYTSVSGADYSPRPVLTLLIQTGVSCEWANDSQRLLLENFDPICNSPSHIYYCGLPLSPPSSWLHKHYSAEFSQEVKVVKGLQTGWGTCSRTVTWDKEPMCLACWKDTIAVGLVSGDIIILDAVTGGQLAILSGHTGWMRSLAFSPDATSLVSGSENKTLKLWDMQTGGVVRTFQGHTGPVYSVSISSDCTTIASGSNDGTVHLWNFQTGECYCVLELQEAVVCVQFSPTDPQHLISVSDHVVQQWDTNGHQIKSTYKGSDATFSSDGAQIVYGGNIVTVRDSGSGAITAKCLGPATHFRSCCISPNGRLIAATDCTKVYVWDITSPDPHPIETLRPTGITLSLKFSSSSSLISASNDRSVKFWQIGTSSSDPAASDPKSTPPTLAPIKSISLQAKDGIAISSDSDGVVKAWDLSTGHCKVSFQTPAKGSHHRGVCLVNNRLILVWCADKRSYTWDVEKGQLLQEVEAACFNRIECIQISRNGSRFFVMNQLDIAAWSMWTGELVGQVQHHKIMSNDIILTVDGSKAWVRDKGWDFGISGSPPIPLSGPPDRPHLDIIGGVRRCKTELPGIEDTVTGKEVFQLPARFVTPSHLQWDGQYLVAGYENGEVLILDFSNMLLQ